MRQNILAWLAFASAIILAIGILEALSLTTPTWTPGVAFTNDTLNCSWTYGPDTTLQNITVYRNGIIYNTTLENASLVNLTDSTLVSPSVTAKGQVWACEITVYNATESSTKSREITIKNSPPTTEGVNAGIFNDSDVDVGFSVQLEEDVDFNLDVNATDADGDVLTYLPGDVFCSRLSSSAGTYRCSPSQSDLSDNLPTQHNITFTVTDGQNPAGRTITFNVTPVNDAPNVSVSDQQTPVNESLNYTFSATDEELDHPLTHVLIINASNSEISDRISLTGLNSNVTSVSFFYDGQNPDFNDVGLWPIWINTTDGGNASVVNRFYLNVTPVGRPPHFVSIDPSGPYNISQGEFIQINITANDEDANSTLVFTDNTDRFEISTVRSATNVSDAFGQINYTPSNAHVGLFTVVVTITDQENLDNSSTLVFNVTNVNDPPLVEETSTSPANTQQNTNASNLTGYANTPFVYDVNATDPDSIHGETLSYLDNTTLFAINSSTGRIDFTPTDAQVSPEPYHINVTVTDSQGLQDSRTLFLVINSNSPPRFNVTPLPSLNCTTDSLCSFDLSGVSEDPDAGDSIEQYAVAFVSGSLESFSHNDTTGLINFTPTKYDVGNYTINITISDTFGATNSSLLSININNTPVSPNLTRFDFSQETIVETHGFTFEFRATDRDFLAPGIAEQINFTTNLSLNYSIIPLSTDNITGRALFSITPSLGDAGNYTIGINSTDAFGLSDEEVITFEIFPKVPPPDIVQIAPWGSAPNFTLNRSYISTSLSQFSDDVADVVLAENTTVNFSVIVDDSRPVTYNWTLGGQQVGTGENYSRSFDFFSAGSHIIAVNVTNDRFESSRFNWTVNVTNVNRPPQIVTPLGNRTSVNGTETITNYFVLGNGIRFYDPDDDLDSDGQIDGAEANSLTFAQASACTIATLSISGEDLTITGTSVGSCQVRFTATDPSGASLQSNLVQINITDIPEGSQTTQTVVSSGGGGGSSSRNTFIPIIRDDTTPDAFSLVAPKLVTIYENGSVVIPIVLNNTWRDDLEMIRIRAEANESRVSAELDADLIEELLVNESRVVHLTVQNYRLGENYEVIVRANISDPEYEDEALILLNSIEQASEGDQVRVKVTFANDLLNQHPECQELNEILSQADERLRSNDYEEARRLVDGVINGCKYLVSLQNKVEERPARLNPLWELPDFSAETFLWSALTFVVLLSLALLIYYHYTHEEGDDF